MSSARMEGQPVVTSKQAEDVINGIPTQVVCSAFTDHIVVVVTQYGKLGTLVSLTPNTVTGDLSKPTLTTKVLLGCDEPLVHVCAKNLVSFVSQESKNKPVLLGIALKDKSAECINTLKGLIKSCQVW
ncbi:proteasome assembly chaperone 3 isoform 1-T2 [Mantella aurantiaca]